MNSLRTMSICSCILLLQDCAQVQDAILKLEVKTPEFRAPWKAPEWTDPAYIGFDKERNVVDSSKVPPGAGSIEVGPIRCSVGEITGHAVGNSRFKQINVDMTKQQVEALLGPPDDQRHGTLTQFTLTRENLRKSYTVETTYKGTGRLLFYLSPLAGCSGLRLFWIIHNGKETGILEEENKHRYAFNGTPPPQALLKFGPGTNESGEVVDPTKLETGFGMQVTGKRGPRGSEYTYVMGEVTGRATPGGAFEKLEIGMPIQAAQAIVGAPTAAKIGSVGKSSLMVGDNLPPARMELAYKGQGRLLFAGGIGGWQLVWIIHNKNETGVLEANSAHLHP